MKKLFILIFSTLFFMNIYADNFDNYSKRVVGEGWGSIKKGDWAKARDEAIWAAQKDAVEQGVGVFISSDTKVENAQLIDSNIYTQANGFIDTYKILEEMKEDDGYYVKIKAVVKTSELGDKLLVMGLIKKIGDPRIMVVISEKNLNKRENTPAAETTIIKHLIETGYRVVDQEQVNKIRYSEQAKKLIDGDLDYASSLAKQFGADILITGSASTESKGEIYGMYSVGSEINLKAIKIDVGEIIFTATVHSVDLDINAKTAGRKALRKAAYLLSTGDGKEPNGRKVDSILPKIAKSLLQRPSIQLLFDSITEEEYNHLIRLLKEERTIKGVYPRQFLDNTARIDVDYDRTIDKFKELLKSLEALKFIITNSSRNKIEAKVISSINLYIKDIKYKDFKALLEVLNSNKNTKILNRTFNMEKSTVEIEYSKNLYELADYLETVKLIPESITDDTMTLIKEAAE